MKLHEILQPDTSVNQLDEISLKNAVGASIIAGSSLLGAKNVANAETPFIPKPATIVQPTKHIPSAEEMRAQQEAMFIQNITKKYRISPKVAKKVVNLAHKYEDPEFPKAIDILAIVGIESNFNPSAVSALKKDPAVGLMQVRPGVWGIDPTSLQSMEAQIKHGSEILKNYYDRLNDKEDTVQAYNIGLRGFRNNKNPEAAQRYLNKYNQELQNYTTT